LSDRLPLLKEIQRKLIHLSACVIPTAYYLGIEREYILIICGVLSGGFLFADILRLNFALAQRYFLRIFSKLLREKEISENLTGASFLFAGMMLTVLLFHKEAAIPALFIVTLADPMAALIGKRFGRHKLLGKTLEGSFGFFITASAVMIIFTGYGWLGIAVALLAALVEIVPLKLNDNILIPVISGFLLSKIG